MDTDMDRQAMDPYSQHYVFCLFFEGPKRIRYQYHIQGGCTGKLATKKELRGYRYLLAESDCACLEKRDMRMRKMMGSSWNRAENPPYTHI